MKSSVSLFTVKLVVKNPSGQFQTLILKKHIMNNEGVCLKYLRPHASQHFQNDSTAKINDHCLRIAKNHNYCLQELQFT